MSVLSDLYATYNNYCARRDAAQAKIDALEDLYDVLDGAKFEIEFSKIHVLSEVGYGFSVFCSSTGYAVGEIQYDCHPDSENTSYTKLMDYYNSLDTIMDQINTELVALREEKRADIWLIDDAAAAIDAWWTEHVTNSHN